MTILNYVQQEKLLEKMKQLNLTQTEIARINKVSPQMINKFCTGKYNTTPKIKEYFLNCGINIDDLISPLIRIADVDPDEVGYDYLEFIINTSITYEYYLKHLTECYELAAKYFNVCISEIQSKIRRAILGSKLSHLTNKLFIARMINYIRLGV